MEHDGRNINFTGNTFRMDRLEQIVTPQHSTLQSLSRLPTAPEGANPLDLTSAIVHELQRSNSTAGLQHARNHESPLQEPANGLLPFGAFLWQNQNAINNSSLDLLPQYIPRFDETLALAASLHHQTPMRFSLQAGYSTESESLGTASHQGFFSRSTSANRFPPLPAQQQVPGEDYSTMRAACSPWIERMMQADVTPTPCPSLGISTSLSLAQRAVGDVSCVVSATVDPLSRHSSDMQQWSENQSMRSTFNGDPADLCTDEEDLETRPIDEKRKKRMLSNRASAQRSRQRRQERLDQLEVLTAQLRVENSALQKKLSAAIQVAKKLEDQNTNLVKKVEKLSEELNVGKPKKVFIAAAAAVDECASSRQTTCASSCEMIGGRKSVDPTLMRDGNVNDAASTPSMSAGSPGWPSGSCSHENERDMDFTTTTSNGNNNNINMAELSPVRRSFSACRMGKKRPFSESGNASFGGSHTTSVGNHMGSGGSTGHLLASAQPNRPRLSPATPTGGDIDAFPEPSSAFVNSFGFDPTLEADRWLEFAECFKFVRDYEHHVWSWMNQL